MMHRTSFITALVLACSTIWGQEQPKPPEKPVDVVVMRNGDRLSGEIKKVEHGLLYIETPYISGEQVAVDWLQVERIESARAYRVVLNNGARLVGQVHLEEVPGSDKKAVSVHNEDHDTLVPQEALIEVAWQKRNFFRQLKGNIDFGYNYTSGNDQVQGDFDATTKFESPTYRMEGDLSSTISLVSGANETNRQQLTALFGRYLSRRDIIFGATDFLKSSQQKLQLRSTFGAGYGRGFIKTPRTELNIRAGLAYNREEYDPTVGSQSIHNSIESLFSVDYSTFRFNRSQLDTNLRVMPSLSDLGRVRSNLTSTYSLKLVNEFHFQIHLWDTYDSRPPIKARKNELGVSTGLGWSY
jgi:putative salt-induced outer membrane protein YdiY